MKTITSLLAIIALTALAGCSTTSSQRAYSGMPVTEIVATVSCSDPGMRFTGTIVSDGHVQKYSGVSSGTYRASGHEIVCSFKKSGTDGKITLAVSEAGHQEGQSSTPVKFGGVRAELVRTLEAQSTLFTTF
jgi:hypothetical protein